MLSLRSSLVESDCLEVLGASGRLRSLSRKIEWLTYQWQTHCEDEQDANGC